MCMPVYVSNINFCENGKLRMKCVQNMMPAPLARVENFGIC